MKKDPFDWDNLKQRLSEIVFFGGAIGVIWWSGFGNYIFSLWLWFLISLIIAILLKKFQSVAVEGTELPILWAIIWAIPLTIDVAGYMTNLWDSDLLGLFIF